MSLDRCSFVSRFLPGDLDTVSLELTGQGHDRRHEAQQTFDGCDLRMVGEQIEGRGGDAGESGEDEEEGDKF